MTMHLEDHLSPAWGTAPLYCGRFGNHYFFVMHPLQAVAPPASNPSLGPKDAAMIALLDDNLPTMNQEVADNAERIRNSPPPAPVVPGPKKFWRIRADWSLDTDGDGCKDWAEFEMASNSGHPSHVLADPFNGDVDGNGIPDGQQIDFDQDGTKDTEDIAPSDPVLDQIILPEVRYALFPIAGTAPPPERLAPLEINNQGIVLYRNGTWKSGQWTPLEEQGTNLKECTARGINDRGEIVGVGNYLVRELDNYRQAALTRWQNKGSQPEVVEDSGLFAVPYGDFSTILGDGPRLSNDGSVIAHSARIGLPEGGSSVSFVLEEDGTHFLWTLPGSGRTVTQKRVGGDMSKVASKDVYWGRNSAGKGAVVGYGLIGELDWEPRQVLAMSSGAPLALGADKSSIYYNGSWRHAGIYGDAFDSANDGTAISRRNSGMPASVLLNGKWRPTTRAAGSNVPEVWLAGDVVHLDSSSGGWILTSRGTPTSPEFAAMLPVRIEGEYNNSKGQIESLATGVDGFSIRADNMDPAAQDRLWIMAPQDGVTKVRIMAPLSYQTPLQLSAEGVSFNGQPTAELNSEEDVLLVRANSGATSGTEVLANLKLDSLGSASKPLGFKVMKRRTLKVKVYKVIKTDAHGNEQAIPNLVPDEDDLQEYLNDVYKSQINLDVEVRIDPEPLRVNWDIGVVNQSLEGSMADGNLSLEQSAIQAAKNARVQQAGHQPWGEHITVYAVGCSKPIGGDGFGEASIGTKTCWVVGNRITYMNNETLVPYSVLYGPLDTIAHEMGHVMVGKGHPGTFFPGPAPLGGTEHFRRLMCEGKQKNPSSPGKLLVKGEWDAAEIWLNQNIQDPE